MNLFNYGNAIYSSSDPFESRRLFCVSEDIEILDAEIYFQMDGESGIVEIKDRNFYRVIHGLLTLVAIPLQFRLIIYKKEKEYAVRFTGTKINYALIKVTFECELVKEKSRPSK